ncbi:MAG: aminopeptidase, partial [Clostridia bacterium]|nr:aminopeptidase [Clostridia bacterium]
YTGSRGKSGASDANAEFIAKIRGIFEENGVVWQMGELGKVDAGGGGTIAQFVANLDMEVIDCGVALLSMHSPYEIAGKFDIYMAYKGYKAFFEN